MSEGWFFATPEWQAYLAAYGRAHDPHVGRANLVVRLGDEREMWRHMRKGHQAAIRVAARSVDVRSAPGDTRSGRHLFALYRELHLLANGAVRPDETFRLMASWVPRFGQVEIAYQHGFPIAAAYFITYAGGAYYASAARHPEADPKIGAAHLLLWSAMYDLAERGYRWLDMGPDPDGSASDKERSVAHFKRGFGAERIENWRWELS